MKFILAKKLEMSQRFAENGTIIPVTLLQAGPCVVTQVKTTEKDGYNAVQLGFHEAKKPTKSEVGHTKSLGKTFATLQEFRVDNPADYNVGDELLVTGFGAGDIVQATGTSKGKGFQGVVKRHHFGGGPASHGHKDNLRMPGSIGAGGIQRVFKGLRMAGRMGGDQVTVKNLQVVEVDGENGVIAVKGAIPGSRGALIAISS